MNANASHHKPLVMSVVGAIFVIVLAAAAFMLFSSDFRGRNAGGEDGIIGGEFTLTSNRGRTSLSDFKGKVVMVYFGFTNCEFVCPDSMSTITRALQRFDAEQQQDIQVLLVTVDPETDSVEVLDKYTEQFHPNILGLTGSEDEIDLVVEEYGAFFRPSDDKAAGEGYAIRHTSRYFVVDRDGVLVDAMRHGSTPNELAARIRTLI